MFFFESLGTGSDSEPSFRFEPHQLQKLWNRPSLDSSVLGFTFRQLGWSCCYWRVLGIYRIQALHWNSYSNVLTKLKILSNINMCASKMSVNTSMLYKNQERTYTGLDLNCGHCHGALKKQPCHCQLNQPAPSTCIQCLTDLQCKWRSLSIHSFYSIIIYNMETKRRNLWTICVHVSYTKGSFHVKTTKNFPWPLRPWETARNGSIFALGLLISEIHANELWAN